MKQRATNQQTNQRSERRNGGRIADWTRRLFSFKENPQKSAQERLPAMTELGAAGTQLFSGQIWEELQPELVGIGRLDIYDRMRSDAQVAAVLNVIELPIRAADFAVEPAGASRIAQETADFIQNALQEMESSFDDFLRQSLLMLPYGFMLFEKVYVERSGGRVGWRKFAPRMPRTIVRWVLDSEGRLAGVEQRVLGDAARHVTIPARKLIRFTYRQEGDNFEGRPLLRDVYKHWWHKDTLYKFAAIAAERAGVGVPILSVPPGSPEEDRKAAFQIVEAFRAGEKTGIVLPSDFDFTLSATRGFPHMNLIEHHNGMIAKAALAQFLNLGQANVGSFALSASQTDLFLMALNGLLQHLCAVIERQAARELVRWNFGEGAPCPRFRAKLRNYDSRQLAETLNTLAGGELLTPDDSIESFIRESLDLPQKTAAEQRNAKGEAKGEQK